MESPPEDCGLVWKEEPPPTADDRLLQSEEECPKSLVTVDDRGMDTTRHLPFLETNWEVTPASNVAKTGLWSLVMMSLVLPAGGGKAFLSREGENLLVKPVAEVNLYLWKPPEMSWFYTCYSTDLPQPPSKVSAEVVIFSPSWRKCACASFS